MPYGLRPVLNEVEGGGKALCDAKHSLLLMSLLMTTVQLLRSAGNLYS